MNWRERLTLLFGAASPFAFGSTTEALALPMGPVLRDEHPTMDRDAWVYTDPAQRQRLLHLADHRSHSSHSSHSSHYSGSGGHSSHSSHSSHYSGSTSPATAPRPLPAPRPAPLYSAPSAKPSAPSTVGEGPARFTQPETREFVRKMQIALIMKGYDPGPADGQLGGKTTAALKKFQADNDIPATGYMDVDTLRRLGVIN